MLGAAAFSGEIRMPPMSLPRLLSTAAAVTASVSVAVHGCPSPENTDVALMSETLLVMGGSTNGAGLRMREELSGCHLSDCSQWRGYVSGAPGTHYAGYEFKVVDWPGVAPFGTGADGMTFDESRTEGIEKFEQVLKITYQPGEKIVAVGISGSANVLSNKLATLQASRDAGLPTPSPSDLSFVLIGNPNRPNGGVFARFPGHRYRDTTFDGAMPDTDYQVTDISWQWDPVSDFPTYPLNAVAVLNSAIGYVTLHSVYFPADPTDPSTIVQDVTVGNTRYLLLRPDHLPLLRPLQIVGVPQPVIDLIEPSLEYTVELGYDRTVSPGTPTEARWLPPLRNPLDVTAGYVGAVGQGIRNFVDDLAPQGAASAAKSDELPTAVLPDSRVSSTPEGDSTSHESASADSAPVESTPAESRTPEPAGSRDDAEENPRRPRPKPRVPDALKPATTVLTLGARQRHGGVPRTGTTPGADALNPRSILENAVNGMKRPKKTIRRSADPDAHGATSARAKVANATP